MNEPITIEQMADILGGGNPAPADPTPAPADPTPNPTPAEPTPNPNPTPAPADPNPNPSPNPAPAQEPTPAPAPAPADPNVQLQQNKAQAAFADLRVRNKQYEETLKGVATLLGIDGNADGTVLMDTLQAKILENQAKQQNVPVELLQRLQTQEQQLAQFTAQQRQRNIETGFASIKETYKLDAAQMSKFADDLIASGLNPFVQDIDLNMAYRNMHFDEIVAAKAQEAVLAEQTRAAAAVVNGSNPGNQQGSQQQGDITKVNSVRDLETYFNQQLNK